MDVTPYALGAGAGDALPLFGTLFLMSPMESGAVNRIGRQTRRESAG